MINLPLTQPPTHTSTFTGFSSPPPSSPMPGPYTHNAYHGDYASDLNPLDAPVAAFFDDRYPAMVPTEFHTLALMRISIYQNRMLDELNRHIRSGLRFEPYPPPQPSSSHAADSSLPDDTENMD